MLRVFISVLMIASFSQALPQFFNTLSGQFPGGTLIHKCLTCHANKGTPALNLFGNDYRSVFVAPNPLKIPGINIMDLKQKMDLLLNKMDSNINGISNFNDIMKGNNPGVAQ